MHAASPATITPDASPPNNAPGLATRSVSDGISGRGAFPDVHGTRGGTQDRSPPASAGGFYGTVHASPTRKRGNLHCNCLAALLLKQIADLGEEFLVLCRRRLDGNLGGL